MVLDNTLKGDDQIESMQTLIDHVEINALMDKKTVIQEITDITENYQMLTFSMLYCGVCPAATLIVFVYFMVECKLNRYADMYCFQRPLQQF